MTFLNASFVILLYFPPQSSKMTKKPRWAKWNPKWTFKLTSYFISFFAYSCCTHRHKRVSANEIKCGARMKIL